MPCTGCKHGSYQIVPNYPFICMINHIYSDCSLRKHSETENIPTISSVNHYREFPKRTIILLSTLIVLEGFLVTVELHIRLSLLACKYGCYNKAQLQGKSFCLTCSRNYTLMNREFMLTAHACPNPACIREIESANIVRIPLLGTVMSTSLKAGKATVIN